MLDLIDLRVFGRIADVGSISGAARSLGMPKSSVSRSLVKLEKAVGSALIERFTHRLRLTDAGLVLQRHVRSILNGVAEAEDAVAGLSGKPRGDLRVTAPFTFAVGPIARMMPAFMARFPQIRVSLTIDNRVVDIVGEEYDVAIRVGALADSALIARRLATIDMWLCTSPGYLARTGPVMTVNDLDGRDLVSIGHESDPWRFRDTGGMLGGRVLATRVAIGEPDAMLVMVAGDAGIALLPHFIAAPAVADGRVVRLLPSLDFGSVPAHALFSSHRKFSPKVRLFVAALVAELHGGLPEPDDAIL